jgi:hypothetical protein
MHTIPPPPTPNHDQPSSSSSSSSSSTPKVDPTEAREPARENSAPTRDPRPATQNRANPPAPGRPTLYSERILEILTHIIATTGRSDSAAAELAGIGTSTISRWKMESPELTIHLLRAREQFRERQLQIIGEASHQRGGWRAAAWLLERIFPEDYSPRASEREKFTRLAEERHAREGEALARAHNSHASHPAESPAARPHPHPQPHPHPHPQTARPAASTAPGVASQNSQNPTSTKPSTAAVHNLSSQHASQNSQNLAAAAETAAVDPSMRSVA